ncbi:MAG: hypothetical protein SFU86_06965 [Pirellulaceae bacterium]|nr:hypothetical protein [Pirellulaceae bacterium]
MARTLGKLLQVVGLVLLPAAMVMQLTGPVRAPLGVGSVSAMLVLMVFGFAVFNLGRIVEGYGTR